MIRPRALAYGAAAAILACITGRATLVPAAYLYDTLSPPMAALALAGWVIATAGPLALSA